MGRASCATDRSLDFTILLMGSQRKVLKGKELVRISAKWMMDLKGMDQKKKVTIVIQMTNNEVLNRIGAKDIEKKD